MLMLFLMARTEPSIKSSFDGETCGGFFALAAR
jgi:hypothetical protein